MEIACIGAAAPACSQADLMAQSSCRGRRDAAEQACMFKHARDPDPQPARHLVSDLIGAHPANPLPFC